MIIVRPLLGAIAATFMTTAAVQAETLAAYTHAHGIGAYDPMGNGVLGADWVTVSDNNTQRFSDSFDFAGLAYATINPFILTLDFSLAGTSDGLLLPLADLLSPQPIPVCPLTDFLSCGGCVCP